jgi:hypothetical protein
MEDAFGNKSASSPPTTVDVPKSLSRLDALLALAVRRGNGKDVSFLVSIGLQDIDHASS